MFLAAFSSDRLGESMKTVRIKSYAKINMTLEILGVENGYHMLDSLVASIDLYDSITLKPKKGKLSSIVMRGKGSESIPPEENNALKAAEAFSEKFGTDGADISVVKDIPIGAGLGGSSADVSGVLRGMAQMYGIDDKEGLKELADSLGSDTGYMLTGGYARMTGRGERLTGIETGAKLHFLLLCPNSSVSSGACYKKYDELPRTLEYRGSQTENAIEALLDFDMEGVGRCLMNDLYVPALHLNPDVKSAYDEAKSFSPLGVTMTGSGSGVLALFECKELCEWAKSRYRGKSRVYVVETIVPDYEEKKKKPSKWRNPFVLTKEESELLK